MKLEIRITKEPFDIVISDELENEDIIDFLGKLVDFMEKREEFLFSEIDYQDEIDSDDDLNEDLGIDKLTEDEIQDAKNKGKNPKVMKLAKDSKLSSEKIELVFDFDDPDKDLFPLISPFEEEKARTKNQRKAILLFLYQSNVIYEKNMLTSRKLIPLLDSSRMDSSELSKSFKEDKSGVVRQTGSSYRITKKGMLEARELLKTLVNQV